MSARRAVLLAAYWLAVAFTAAVAGMAAALPFTGRAANCAGITAMTAVCLTGITYAPNPSTRKDDAR